MAISKRKTQIKSWRQFAKKVRSEGCNLLTNIERYPNSILVAGCQRSGTTAVANIITTSDGMQNYWVGKDSELDAALLLSGQVTNEAVGRYCFQTTYLNECVAEYLKYTTNYKLIWLVRNPYSVVYSMLYNWGTFAFNELFEFCGSKQLSEKEMKKYKRFGQIIIPRIKRACLSYNVKTSQALMLKDELDSSSFMVIDYDDLVVNSRLKLKSIYQFIDLAFNESYLEKIRSENINKFQKFSSKDKDYIEEACIDTYMRVKSLAI